MGRIDRREGRFASPFSRWELRFVNPEAGQQEPGEAKEAEHDRHSSSDTSDLSSTISSAVEISVEPKVRSKLLICLELYALKLTPSFTL